MKETLRVGLRILDEVQEWTGSQRLCGSPHGSRRVSHSRWEGQRVASDEFQTVHVVPRVASAERIDVFDAQGAVKKDRTAPSPMSRCSAKGCGLLSTGRAMAYCQIDQMMLARTVPPLEFWTTVSASVALCLSSFP